MAEPQKGNQGPRTQQPAGHRAQWVRQAQEGKHHDLTLTRHVNSQNLQRPTGAGATLVGNNTTERVWRCAAQCSDGSGGNVPPFGDTEKTPGFCWVCAVVVQYLFKPGAFHTVGKHSTELHPSPQKRFRVPQSLQCTYTNIMAHKRIH